MYPLPDNTSYEAGAALGVAYATAHRVFFDSSIDSFAAFSGLTPSLRPSQALFRSARAHAGETCLIHGASGGVGLAAVQLAKACGCIVIGTASRSSAAACLASAPQTPCAARTRPQGRNRPLHTALQLPAPSPVHVAATN